MNFVKLGKLRDLILNGSSSVQIVESYIYIIVMLIDSGSFEDGVIEGRAIAEDIWADNGSDCGYIFNFQADVDV